MKIECLDAKAIGDITLVHNWLLLPSITYMVSATLWSVMKERKPKSAV